MAINFLQSIDLNKNELQNASLHPLGANPGTPSTGQFYFNTGDDTIRVYNGSGWVTFSGGSVTLATSSVAGIVKLFSDTDQSVAANSVSTTAGRTYGVQLNASDQMVVNVPWTDTTGAVTSVDETTPGTSTGTPIVVNPTTGNVQVQSMAYAGTTNVGHVPAGGTASTFLRGDGTWVTPTDTQPLTTEQVQDIVGTQIVTNGTHDGISVTYDDGTDGGINFTNTDKGSAQNIFKNFAVATQSTVVADSNNDTLTFVAGSNVTITTNATSDSITIAATDTNDNTTYDFNLAAVSGNATVLTLDASTGDDDTVTFEGTTNEIEITTPATGDAGTVKIGLPSNVVIAGDLTVNGTTTTISTTNLNVEDALIGLQAELTGANSNDIGFIFERGTSGNNGVFIWDRSAGEFALGTTTATPASTGDLTYTTSSLIADLSGNADTATQLATSRNFSISGGGITASAQSFNGTANVVLNASIDNDAVTYAKIQNVAANNVFLGNDNGAGSAVQELSVAEAKALLDLTGTNSGDESAASTTVQGIVELATSAETITGTDTTRAVTPDGLAARSVVSQIVAASLVTDVAAITHNLGTEDIIVQLFDSTTKETVYADVARTTLADVASTNVIKITFGQTPTNNVDVIITSARGATSVSPAYS